MTTEFIHKDFNNLPSSNCASVSFAQIYLLLLLVVVISTRIRFHRKVQNIGGLYGPFVHDLLQNLKK